MLPQFGFAEIIVLALLAIIVVGPKDLPKLMRSFGNFMAKIRGLGQEFKDAFEEMGAEDEIAEMRKELEDLKKMGSVDNLTGGLDGEMRSLDKDLRDAVNTKPNSNPKSTAKSKQELTSSETNPELAINTPSDSKAKPQPKSKPQTKPKSKKKSEPKTKTKPKPKPKQSSKSKTDSAK